jgi:pilus assembly protein CpaB
MARSGAGGPAGRINRRFLMLALVSAALSAMLVYVAISRSGGGNEGESTATATIVVAAVDIPARTQITEKMVQVRDVPVGVKPEASYGSVEEVVGKVTRYPISVDEEVTSSKVVSLDATTGVDALSFTVPKGMRAISIKADQVLSAGGLVLPGDYVDLIAVFNVKNAQGNEEENWLVRTVLQNVEVLAVAQTITDVPLPADTSDGTAAAAAATPSDEQRARGSEAKPDPEATTLTLLVQPEQAEWLFLAEANGTLRAVVRGFGDSDTPDVRAIVESELWPAGMPAPPSYQAGP